MSDPKVSSKYRQMEHIKHIKELPDTYVGSSISEEKELYVYDNEKIQKKTINWVPALYKIFDEIIVNAVDNHTRTRREKEKFSKKMIRVMSKLEVNIDKENGIISVLNDGEGIEVKKIDTEKKKGIYVIELIFGELLTSENFKDGSEKKVTGGKNGYGAKLSNIFSDWFTVESVDRKEKLLYTQTWTENMEKKGEPIITEYKGQPYTKITFLPDYKRFGMEKLTDDMYNLLVKRCYDIGAVTSKQVKVKLNKELLPVRTFEQYVDLYIGTKTEKKRLYEVVNNRWEYAVTISPLGEFSQISFVNGIHTRKGGKHVEYLLNQIVKKLVVYIEKKKKIKVKPVTIKEQIMLFVKADIENPSFDSQTKEYLSTPSSKFGSSCSVSDKIIDKLAKMGIMDNAIALTEIKDNKAAKKTDGKKTKNIRGIPKLLDANFAGGVKSAECTLILCEGDSAKAGVVSGLSKEDRNYYGVFPLKGKLLNTRDTSQKKINDNAEIINIKKIMGLITNKKYTDEAAVKKELRYGKILFMTDQDLDGSHIKGLCINLFHSQWPELTRLNSFLGFMNTPILKAKKGSKTLQFYNEQEYVEWKKANNNGKGWSVKYYKGLGTSTAKEFKEYFEHKKIVSFKYNDQTDDNAIDMVFNKHRSNDRKKWLGEYNPNDTLNTNNNSISIQDFTNKEMIHFSKYDCERSIPNAIDGFKTSTRKIVYAAFLRNLIKEIKVGQFGGYVSEKACYHHGEASLYKAIIGLAQEYVGSNNVNPLLPLGQFGTRLEGGSDHASERYICTALNDITKYIFPKEDFPVLNYLDDDGTLVEPEFYVPIVPMILINGGKGIGTGFSYEGQCYNMENIINYLKQKLKNKPLTTKIDVPYYEGFTGDVFELPEKKFLIKGKYNIVKDDTIQITELPIGTWTVNYKTHLEYLMEDKDKRGKKKKPLIKSIQDMCTDAVIDFTIRFHKGVLGKLISKNIEYGCNKLEKELKLYTTKSTTNMNLFNDKQRLVRYENVESIIEDYYAIRLETYQKRKDYQIESLNKFVKILSNKAKFIKEQCDDVIDLRKKKKDAVIQLLKSRGYDVLDGDENYKYLRTMTIDSVEEENYLKLMKEKDEKLHELSILMNTSIQDLWLKELNILKKQWNKYKESRKNRVFGIKKKSKKIKIKKKSN